MPPDDNRADAPPAMPERVLNFAAERQLGTPIDARREVGGLSAVLTGAVVAAVSLGFLILTGALGEASDASPLSALYSVLRFVALFCFFSFVWGVVYAIRGLVVGTRITYLFAGGLVHQRRSGLRAAAWPEITELESILDKRTQGKEGKVLGYKVKAADGPDFAVPLLLVDGRDAFIDRVVDELSACGRPVR